MSGNKEEVCHTVTLKNSGQRVGMARWQGAPLSRLAWLKERLRLYQPTLESAKDSCCDCTGESCFPLHGKMNICFGAFFPHMPLGGSRLGNSHLMRVHDPLRGGVGEEGVKRGGEWKHKGGAAGVDRLQMCLSDKLEERVCLYCKLSPVMALGVYWNSE